MKRFLSMNTSKEKNAVRIIEANKGVIRAGEAIRKRIHPELYMN